MNNRSVLFVSDETVMTQNFLMIDNSFAFVLLIVSVTAAILFRQRHHFKRFCFAFVAVKEKTVREEEQNRLVSLSCSLAIARTTDGLRDALGAALREFTSIDANTIWALIRIDDDWVAVAGGCAEDPRYPSPTIKTIADSVMKTVQDSPNEQRTVILEKNFCFPMTVGSGVVGVLGIPMKLKEEFDVSPGQMSVIATILGITARNIQLVNEASGQGIRDSLTGCFDRDHGMRLLSGKLQRARYNKEPLSLVMLDLDNFKLINDRHGHLCGDAVLRAIGRCMREVFPSTSIQCRFGGEEFFVVLSGTAYGEAVNYADQLRNEIGSIEILWQEEIISTTGSVGVAVAGVEDINSEILLTRADAALYRAKEKGRNRVCVDVKAKCSEIVPVLYSSL